MATPPFRPGRAALRGDTPQCSTLTVSGRSRTWVVGRTQSHLLCQKNDPRTIIGEPASPPAAARGQMPEGGGSIRSACGRVNRPIIAVCKHLHTLSPLQTGWV